MSRDLADRIRRLESRLASRPGPPEGPPPGWSDLELAVAVEILRIGRAPGATLADVIGNVLAGAKWTSYAGAARTDVIEAANVVLRTIGSPPLAEDVGSESATTTPGKVPERFN